MKTITNQKNASLLVAGLALALAAVPSVAEAGFDDFGGANCLSDKVNGVSRCVGTLRAFRHAPHPEDVARFITGYWDDGTVRRYFGASYAGNDYNCTFPAGFSEATWTQLLSNPDLTFSISWEWAVGYCKLESLHHDSSKLEPTR